MSIHNIKEIIQYVPEAVELTKKASVRDDFPTNSKESTILSALEVAYLTKVANELVSCEVVERVDKATRLYGVSDTIEELSGLMSSRAFEKQASVIGYQEEVKQAEEVLESMGCGLFNLEKVASRAEQLYDDYGDYVSSDFVRLYAGVGYLNKEAAELGLAIRYKRTGNEGFMKVARIIHGSDVSKLSEEDNRSIAHAVVELEKEAHLTGLNFYEEAFMVKAAEVMVKLAGQQVSADRIIAVAPSISNVIGEDVAEELSKSGSEEVKAIAESLPLDLQQLIAKYA